MIRAESKAGAEDSYINKTFQTFLIYTTKDHTESQAEMYINTTPEATRVPAPVRLEKRKTENKYVTEQKF